MTRINEKDEPLRRLRRAPTHQLHRLLEQEYCNAFKSSVREIFDPSGCTDIQS